MTVIRGQQCGHSLKVRSCPEKTCFIFSPSFRLFRGLVGPMGLALTSPHPLLTPIHVPWVLHAPPSSVLRPTQGPSCILRPVCVTS